MRFGLTARQFNALAATLRGKVASIKEHRPGRIQNFERRIARARKVLATTRRGTDKHHQKHRRLAILEQRLSALRADDAAGRVRLCFGSRKLFRRQFALKANGYASHADWRREWRVARSAQFFVLGSKDETAGCQGCVATVAADGSLTLRLRLPNALAADGRRLVIPGLRFAYGHEAIVAALEDIAELANVARPGVRAEPVQHLGRDICHLGGVFAIQVLEQRLGKDGQIVLALPQGGQGNGKDVEAVEQVFPELAFADCIIEL